MNNTRKKTVKNPDGAGGKSGKIVKGQNDPKQTREIVAEETGVRPRNDKSLSQNDKDLPRHNTQLEVAKAAGVSTGTVAQAAKRHKTTQNVTG